MDQLKASNTSIKLPYRQAFLTCVFLEIFSKMADLDFYGFLRWDCKKTLIFLLTVVYKCDIHQNIQVPHQSTLWKLKYFFVGTHYKIHIFTGQIIYFTLVSLIRIKVILVYVTLINNREQENTSFLAISSEKTQKI